LIQREDGRHSVSPRHVRAYELEEKARGSGWRNPWSDERARFLSAWREESEERIELVFLAGKKERGFEDTGLSLDGDAL
jgi:hypothetical protein